MIYSLSTDYNVLFDLLLSGETVVGFVPLSSYFVPDRDTEHRDVCEIVRYDEFDIFIGVRGTGYGGLFPYMQKYGTEREVFIQHCANIGLQWIQGRSAEGEER